MSRFKNWRTLAGRHVQGDLYDLLRMTILREKAAGHELLVCIGTDSQVKRDYIEFGTVIVFIRKGRGGFMFISNDRVVRKLSIRERMLEEVHRSVELAHELSELFTRYKVHVEIHADINTDPAHGSNVALADAMGYIIGMGFLFKAKPRAFASSSCANKVVQ